MIGSAINLVIIRVTECPWATPAQDDDALTLVDDGVDDQPGAAAVGGGPLVGELVVAIAGLARVLQQLLDPRADLLTGVLGQAGVVGVGDLQPDQAVAGHRCRCRRSLSAGG